jgi:hypothetical protein
LHDDFGQLRTEFEGFRCDANQRLDQTNQRLENLEHSQSEMVELLKMIAHNTSK